MTIKKNKLYMNKATKKVFRTLFVIAQGFGQDSTVLFTEQDKAASGTYVLPAMRFQQLFDEA